jgi:hypothetical protein
LSIAIIQCLTQGPSTLGAATLENDDQYWWGSLFVFVVFTNCAISGATYLSFFKARLMSNVLLVASWCDEAGSKWKEI